MKNHETIHSIEGSMICPICGSVNTKKPSVIDKRWKVGTEICLDCDYQGNWTEFLNSTKAAPSPLEKPKG